MRRAFTVLVVLTGLSGAAWAGGIPTAHPVDAFRVMLAHSDSSVYAVSLCGQLLDSSYGAFTSVDQYDLRQNATFPATAWFNQGYRAILTFSYYTRGYLNRDLAGDSLARFIQLGGGVVEAVFSDQASVYIGGSFRRQFSCLSLNGNAYTYGNMGQVNLPGHPVLQGVRELYMGNFITDCRTNDLRASPRVYSIAEWYSSSSGRVLAAGFDSGGRRVAAAGFLPTAQAHGVAVSGDWLRLLVNALRWVAPGQDDVGVTRLLAPVGTIDSGDVVVPACTVLVFSTGTVTYPVRMRIGSFYNQQVQVVNQPGTTRRYVTFPGFSNWPRGTHVVTCSTELIGDQNPGNDRQNGTLTVRVRDVGVTRMIAPVGIIDSGQVVVPCCSVYNFGTDDETYGVRARLGTMYDQTAVVYVHHPATARFVTFPSWIARGRSTASASCSTELAGDRQPANDAQRAGFFVQVSDVGVMAIIAPSGGVDSGVPVVPLARVRNHGTATETFGLIFRTEDGYSTWLTRTLGPTMESTMVLPGWIPQRRGSQVLTCSTALPTDLNRANDRVTSSVQVNVHDAAVTAFVTPSGATPPGPLLPCVSLRNAGSVRDSLNAVLSISSNPPYQAVVDLPAGIPPGRDTAVIFPVWSAQYGNYVARCSLFCARDQVARNDTFSHSFEVIPPDVGAISIIAPVGRHDSTEQLKPSAAVRNYRACATSFVAHYRVKTSSQTVVYHDSLLVRELSAYRETTLVFATWPGPHQLDVYAVCCSTARAGDDNPANDAVTGSFVIQVLNPGDTGWLRLANVPPGPQGKSVKDGGCLTHSSDRPDGPGAVSADGIYLLKGNGTCEFYRYDIARSVWEPRESIPAFGRSGRKRTVRKGATITAAGGRLYAAKGGATLEWWEYDPNRVGAYPWQQMADIPEGIRTVKEGASAVAVRTAGADRVYLLKGSSTLEFYCYDPVARMWERGPDAPAGFSGKTFRSGSALAADESGHGIYAIKGTTNEFACYEVNSHQWNMLASLPLIGSAGRKKKAREGASLACVSNRAYVLKGGDCTEFWSYLPQENRWQQLPDIPPGSGKGVRGGGALVAVPHLAALFATKGNRTLDFFRYGLAGDGTRPAVRMYPNVQDTCPPAEDTGLLLAVYPSITRSPVSVHIRLPRPGRYHLRLYDVAGRPAMTPHEGTAGSAAHLTIPTCHLLPGVYLLTLETDNAATTTRLVVE